MEYKCTPTFVSLGCVNKNLGNDPNHNDYRYLSYTEINRSSYRVLWQDLEGQWHARYFDDAGQAMSIYGDYRRDGTPHNNKHRLDE